MKTAFYILAISSAVWALWAFLRYWRATSGEDDDRTAGFRRISLGSILIVVAFLSEMLVRGSVTLWWRFLLLGPVFTTGASLILLGWRRVDRAAFGKARDSDA